MGNWRSRAEVEKAPKLTDSANNIRIVSEEEIKQIKEEHAQQVAESEKLLYEIFKATS